jgi:hypothetical protein
LDPIRPPDWRRAYWEEPALDRRWARALFLEGHWKVAKATFCEILGRGNVACIK